MDRRGGRKLESTGAVGEKLSDDRDTPRVRPTHPFLRNMSSAEELVRVAKQNRIESIKRSLDRMPERMGTYYQRRRTRLKGELAALELELRDYELFNQGDTVR